MSLAAEQPSQTALLNTSLEVDLTSNPEPIVPLVGDRSSPEDFVFIDLHQRPYRVRLVAGNQYWLLYLHPDKRWVTLRRLMPWEHEIFYVRLSICRNAASMYAFGVPFLGLH